MTTVNHIHAMECYTIELFFKLFVSISDQAATLPEPVGNHLFYALQVHRSCHKRITCKTFNALIKCVIQIFY